jgi:hypothetical protein
MPKIALTVFLILALCLPGSAQDSCAIEKFIQDYYYKDARWLALEEMQPAQSPYKDSIFIPQKLITKYLRLLTTAYNMDRAPFTPNTMHKKGPDSTVITLYISKTVPWIKTYSAKKGSITGNKVFDNLTRKSFFTVREAGLYDKLTYRVVLRSNVLLNREPLQKAFLAIKGIKTAVADTVLADQGSKGSGSDIDYNSKTGELNLFKEGYGIKKWKFRVITPCRLERVRM